LRPLIASMATLALNSGLWVRRLLISGSPDQGRCRASEVNDGACPVKPVHLNPQGHGPGPSQKSAATCAGTSIPLGPTPRNDPSRHQAASPLLAGGPPDHGSSAAWPFQWCGIRKSACGYRRCDTACLCRGCGR